MTQVRIGKDIDTYLVNGTEWVEAHSGGISTFSLQGPGRNWWLLASGIAYSDDLLVVNDHGNHYNWEPNVDMPLSDYIALLAAIEGSFRKVS
jgi:hypothetical protein